MIYAFYGSDTHKVSAKAHAWIDASRKKDPNITYIRMTEDTFDLGVLQENLGGQSLFAKRMLISLDGVLGEHEEEVFELLEAMADSENVFALIDGKIKAASTKKLEKYATKTFVFDAKVSDGKPDFALWNAIDRRDGLTAWKIYYQQRLEGGKAEMIAGFIHSKLRRSKSTRQLSRKFIDMYHEARRGEVDFDEGVEALLLSLG